MCMSLIMLLYTDTGYECSEADFKEQAKEAGFKEVKIVPLAGPSNAGICYKGAADTKGKMWLETSLLF